jgi:DNA helicase-2/ATP-dependent DNA helicase PcrA
MQSDIDSVEELISAAQEYEKRTEDATLQSFLEETALVSDVDKYDEGADACVLMTVHSAKGLEFPVVFLVGMEEGIFPGMQSVMDPSELSEERRLAYVAVTRAKERVFITHVRERLLYGRTAYNKLSRFILDEVPAHLIREDVPASARPFAAAARPAAPRTRQTELSGEFTRRAQMSTQPPLRSGGGAKKFGEGDRVRHSTFGTGTVLSAKDMGGDMLYEVEFDSGTVKKLMGSFARLQAE